MWKVLVADDNAANRELLVAILDGSAQCDLAFNGREAMDKYQQALMSGAAYDVILLDIAMPEVDGIECLKKIRKSEVNAGVTPGEGVPIIMVTSFEQPFMQAFNSGCDDYILKPVDGNILLQKMRAKLVRR